MIELKRQKSNGCLVDVKSCEGKRHSLVTPNKNKFSRPTQTKTTWQITRCQLSSRNHADLDMTFDMMFATKQSKGSALHKRQTFS